MHAIILSGQSDYLKSRLSSCSASFKPDVAKEDTVGTLRHELVEYVEEEELEGMDLLLRCMYTGRVEESMPSPVLLVQALGLANRFCASAPCTTTLASALANAPKESIDLDLLHAVFHEQLSDARALAPMTPFLKACSQRLQDLFGDVPAVIKDEQRRQTFCQLPPAAVTEWIKLDRLSVHSENCIVYLVSAWVEAQEEAGQACSPQHLEQLAREVRVVNLGPAYQNSILPSLAWFQGCKEWLPALQTIRRLRPVDRRECIQAAAIPKECKAWLAEPRAIWAGSGSTTLSWHLDAAELQQLHSEESVASPAVYVNGFMMQVTASS